MLSTPFTRLFAIEHPIVLAGLTVRSDARRAARASESGVLGALSAFETLEELAREVAACRALTARPFAIDFGSWRRVDVEHALIELRLDARIAVIVGFTSGIVREEAAGRIVMARTDDPTRARAAIADGARAILTTFDAPAEAAAERLGDVGGTPVVLASRLLNGRSLAAALAMGAAGIALDPALDGDAEALDLDRLVLEAEALLCSVGDVLRPPFAPRV